MSKRICERCKSENVIEDIYYGGTQYYECQSCLCRGDKDNFPEMTLFHQITSSEEVLAEKLIFEKFKYTAYGDSYTCWLSPLFPGKEFETYEEAFAATVAKLKEVAE